MKIMKKLFAILLTVALLTGMFTMTSLAAGSLGFGVTASALSVKEGETVTVTVSLNSNPGVVGFNLTFNYDSSLFEITGYDASGSCFPGYIGPQNIGGNGFVWFDMSAASAGDNYSTGKLVAVTLKAKANVYGMGMFSVSSNNAANFNEELLSGSSNTTYVGVYLDPANCTEHNWQQMGIITQPTCTEAGVSQLVCSKCNSTSEGVINAFGHQWDDGVITTDPTCTETGVRTYTCRVNNSHTKTETEPALGHDITNHTAQAPTCTAIGWDAYESCSRCDYSTYVEKPSTGHDWDAGVVTLAPTCTDKGIRTYTCQNDNSHTKTEDIEALGHDYADEATFTWTEDVANATWTATYSVECVTPNCDHDATGNATVSVSSSTAETCLEVGTTTYTASVTLDGKTYTDTKTITGAAGPHDWDEGTVTTDPTCTEDGIRTYTCKHDSSHTIQSGEAALGHDPINHAAQAPTCTDIGWDAYVTCSRCDYSTYEEKAALGHDPINHAAQAPTCTATGWDAYVTCSRCDYSTYEEKAALGHDPISHAAQAPTCTDIGWEAYETCSRCDYSTYEEKAALGHDWNDGEITTDPTCTDEGTMTYTCQRDNSHTKTEDIEALGHDWDDGTVTLEPTCTDKGTTTYTCLNDNTHTREEDIEALGHDYADEATFAWSEDTANATWTATYSVKCEFGNCDHVATGTAVITETSSTAANCQEIGTTTYTASITLDGKTYSEDKVINGAAGPHDWDEGTVTTDPTCTDKGVRTYTCELDDSHTKTEDVDPLGHSYESETVAGKDADGHWYSCDKGCDVVSEAEDHIEGTPATCVSGALCDVCGGEFGEIDSDAHKWNEGEIDLEPDCITGTPGNKHFICELDETHTKDEEVPAEHTWDEGTVTREPTTTQEGERTYHCTVEGCEGTKTEPIAKLTPSGGSGSGSSGNNNGYGPKTGDENRPVLWITLASLCLVSIILLLISRKSKKHGRHSA